MLEFKPVTLSLRDEYEKRREQCPVKSADYTFTNLWGWADKYGLSIAFTEHFAFIHQKFPYHCIWSPVGNWFNLEMDHFEKLLNSVYVPYSEEVPTMNIEDGSLHEKLCMHRVTDDLAQYIQQNYRKNVAIIEAKGQWEYIYSQKDLATLAGNRFHKKKNHVNSFYKSYECEFYPLTTQSGVKGSLDDLLELQNEWCKWHDCEHSPSLYAENDAVFRVIGNWEKLGNLFGGSFYIDNQMVAFAVGERLDDENVVVHFEKAKADYRGIYQAINHAFVNNCTEGYSFINREQDLDEEGIRKAKLSYNPVDFLKKSTLVFTM